MNPKTILNKTICFLLFFALCTWYIPNYTKGIDLSDTFYSLAKYKFFFNPEVSLTAASTILTDFLGGIIYHIAPSHQLLVLNFANALSYTFCSLLVIRLFKAELPMPLLLFMALICNFFSLSNMHIFNYNTTTFFMLALSFTSLLTALRDNRNNLLIVSGFIGGLSIFFRLPNVLHLIIALGIFWYTLFCCKLGWRECSRKLMRYIIGVMIAVIIGCIISLCYLGPGSVLSDLIARFQTFTQKESTNSHSAGAMFTHIIYQFTIIKQNWQSYILLLIIGLLIALLTGKLLYKKSKLFPWCNLFFISYSAICSIAFSQKLITISFSNEKFYILWMILIIFSLIISSWGAFYFHKKNAFISTAGFMNFLLILVVPIGTDVGCLYYNYYLFIPMVTMITVLYHTVVIPDSSLIDLKNRNLPIVSLLCSFLLFYTCISGFFYQADYLYRDEPYANLTETVDIPELYGMYTAPQRKNLIETATSAVSPYTDYEIATLGDFNVLPITTDMACFFSRPWPDLASFSVETFVDELNDKTSNGILPIIVFTPNDSLLDDGESPYRSTEKYEALVSVIQQYSYQQIYDSEDLKIYVPN